VGSYDTALSMIGRRCLLVSPSRDHSREQDVSMNEEAMPRPVGDRGRDLSRQTDAWKMHEPA
jgi:hypothetical protein